MKLYLLRNPDGLYLNTLHQERVRHGGWRERDKARLYRSKSGIRSALYGIATPSMKEYLGITWSSPAGSWTDQDRAENRKLWQGIRSIKQDVWWELLLKEGYVLEEVDV